MVTIMSPEGKPIQVAASSLQMGGVQNSTGIYNKQKIYTCPRIVNMSILYLPDLFYGYNTIKLS